MLRRSHFSLATSVTKIVGSNTQLLPKKTSDSTNMFADTVGRHDQIFGHNRIDTGELLAAIDICAARTALKHCFGRVLIDNSSDSASKKPADGALVDKSCATLSMPSIHLKQPIMSGDFLELTGKVCDAGSSSLAVHVNVEKLSWPLCPGELRRVPVADVFSTFVAIGSDLKKLKNSVPPLELTGDEEIKMHKRSQELKRQEQAQKNEEKEIEKLSLQQCKDLEAELHGKLSRLAEKRPWSMISHLSSSYSASAAAAAGKCAMDPSAKLATVPMSVSTLTFSKMFFRGEANIHNSIFGGKLLEHMERCALYTGRRFCGSKEVYTLGLSVNFHQPVLATDAVSIKCRVINVRSSTLEVDVEVFVDRVDGRVLTSNCATFVLVQLDTAGKPRTIPVGLDMSVASLEEHRAAAASLSRYVRLAHERLEIKD